MATRETTIRLSVADNFSAQLRAFARAIDEGERGVKSLGNSTRAAQTQSGDLLKTLGGYISVTAITAGVVGLGKEIVRLGMNMEQTRIAFTTLTGSSAEAQRHLEELRAFAAKTPFQFTDLTEASKRLMAYGFTASEIIPILRDVGDATAALGTGSFGIDRITRALGQMQTRGKIASQEMLQLTEAGIPAWRLLAESMGVTTAEVQKMVEKGLIPAEQGIQAILAGMREDFGGLMAQQAQTAGGALSNLVDALEATGTKLGEDLNPALRDTFVALTELTQGLDTFISIAGPGFWTSVTKEIDAHQQTIVGTSRSYADYRAEMERTNIIAGRAIELWEEGVPTGRLVADTTNILTEAEYNQARALINVGDQRRESIGLLEANNQALLDLRPTLQDQEVAEQAAKESLKDYNEALKDLNFLIAGPIREEDENYIERRDRIQDEIDQTKERLNELAGVQSETAAREMESLGELETKYAENEAAHTEATRKIIFNIVAQQLANADLTQEGAGHLTELARQWGLIDEKTADATQAVIGAVGDVAESGNWDDWLEQIDLITNAILEIPTEVRVSVRIQSNVPGGGPVPDAGIPPDEGHTGGGGGGGGGAQAGGVVIVPSEPEIEIGGMRQHGGSFMAGQMIGVNESWATRPEVVVTPQTGGYVLTRQDAMAALASAGSVTIMPGAVVVNAAPGQDAGEVARAAVTLLGRELRAALRNGAGTQ